MWPFANSFGSYTIHDDAVLVVHYPDGLGRRKTADTGQPLAQRRGH